MAVVQHPEAHDIIDEAAIMQTLQAAHAPDDQELDEILAKARELQGLHLREAAMLLQAGHEQRQRVFTTAKQVKEAIYGDRMVLFAPLYTSNYCVNDCLYCSFRRSNTELPRKRLSCEEIARQVEALENMGHKRMLVVLGEDPSVPITEMVAQIETVYATKTGRGEIRRVNVNAAPMSSDHFRALKDAGIGTYQCFQETYHQETYQRVHPSGPKSDYAARLTVFDRAMAAGIDDVGLGALFGLFDPRFEVLALLTHAAYLDHTYGAGPHTISFPRIEPAPGVPLSEHPPHRLSDDDLKVIVATLRLSVPYTGIIMSTREKPALRDELIHLGVSQLSAGSSTTPGGYVTGDDRREAPQFYTSDTRTLDDMVQSLCASGFLPSFCTACYRRGRTGHDFMDLAKPGAIQTFCAINGMLTLKEYLLDYASPLTRAIGLQQIERHLHRLDDDTRHAWATERLARIEQGERDLYL
ncbi:MAG: [FeFe] hydrogenase H-cluster radical SAM maturase HydG [Armatimonadota bacterium]